MGEVSLERIIKEIKDKGITAYEISKNTPLSEDGINKILSGVSKNPRQTTLLILQEYLFKGKAEKPNDILGDTEIKEKEIPSYIVKNEDRLMQDQTFRLWLTTKIQEGVIKILGGR